ncbi:hypothetical protein SAMN05216223_10466 [Actinacidiphila yanglinensis]|uniref:SPFH domain / Band 7 family protein n=1 Tax=Actinacidiphila yanglinensis TaxID=310779 RepID=A0A1H5YNZ8_9ACTN|nr:hypothetical protein [Actinacidiphila yanglinensis]SEG25480.1 hypothetical protein SAMN05216223_10466 [Actinacidiphila yanglinensis]
MAEELTYDPVVEAAALSGPPPQGTVYVLVGADGRTEVVRPDAAAVPGERRTPRRAVLVDVTAHHLVLPLRLPTRDADFAFGCRVTVVCAVADPAAVALRGIRDVGSTVYGPVRDLLAAVSAEFRPDRRADAQSAMNAALRGFTADPVVRLRDAHAELAVESRVVRGEVVARGRPAPPPPRASRVRGAAPSTRTSRVRGSAARAPRTDGHKGEETPG